VRAQSALHLRRLARRLRRLPARRMRKMITSRPSLPLLEGAIVVGADNVPLPSDKSHSIA